MSRLTQTPLVLKTYQITLAVQPPYWTEKQTIRFSIEAREPQIVSDICTELVQALNGLPHWHVDPATFTEDGTNLSAATSSPPTLHARVTQLEQQQQQTLAELDRLYADLNRRPAT